MGLEINGVQLLVAARKSGVQFNHTVMLGRSVLNVFPQTMVSLLERNGLSAGKFRRAGSACAYAEPFFEALGASVVDTIDNSDYEGAKLVHDLNQPIPPAWHGQFDVVYDGGTLEHVFNFPMALRNSMELLRPGGRLFIHTCANNLCGHGFYQFSPELFYRTLSLENGFEVERMIVHRVGPYGNWYEVSDPNVIQSRVELITFTPIHMLVQAKRIAVKEIFSRTPQQSDYVMKWQEADKTIAETVRKPVFARAARLVHVIKTGLKFYRLQSLSNRNFFRRIARE
ncbi:MAG TPA: methyltransferase domain-containing protein [Verrucomicrobiae bacterium]|jgi:SAM-dependent methyltransferase